MREYFKKVWTEEMDQVLVNLYPTTTMRKIAEVLGVTYYSAKSRIEDLMEAGRIQCKRKPWTVSEIQYLLDWHGKVPMRDIALSLDRDYSTVCVQYWRIRQTKKEATP